MSQQIRTPEGFQPQGAQSAFAADGTIPVGASYASSTGGADLTLPSAEAVGGSMIVVDNLDGVATFNLVASAGETIDGAASVIVGASATLLVYRTGATELRSSSFA